jgi:hypothetical protein
VFLAIISILATAFKDLCTQHHFFLWRIVVSRWDEEKSGAGDQWAQTAQITCASCARVEKFARFVVWVSLLKADKAFY